MKKRQLLIASLIFAVTTTTYAQRTLVFEDQGSGQEQMTITVADQIASMLMSRSDGNQGRLLYNGIKDKFFMVMDDRKKYMDMATMAKAAGNLSDMFSGAMDGLTPEQKEKMQGVLGNLGDMFNKKKKPAAAKPAKQLERTGKHMSVADVDCEVVILRRKQTETEMCIAKPDAVGLNDEDYRTIDAMMKKMESFAAQMSKMSGEDSMAFGGKDLGGIPVSSKQLKGPGAGQHSRLVNSSDQVDESRTLIPADYQMVDMSTMAF